jgi:transketolase
VSDNLENLAINSIRVLSIDAIQKANSGHPGLPMGCAAMSYALWTKYLRHNPQNPGWADRDRFVLSGGHGSMLIYSLLYLSGYDLPLEELKNFRQWDSKTPGHPEYGETPGVEMTTGPLGQGISTAVGMALAEAYLADYFNRDGHSIVDHYTYVLASDGDLMEGVSSEACSLAGTWGLGKLIVLYDDNKITLDGEAKMTFTEDVKARFKAYGWHTIQVEDGNDVQAINTAIEAAQTVTDKPSLVAIRTIIGYGSPNKAGTSSAHGSPLGADEVKLTKEALGWPQEDFYVPEEALTFWRGAVENGDKLESDWNTKFAAWSATYPELAKEWEQAMSGELPEGWDADIPTYTNEKPLATRNVSGEVLNAIAKNIPTMMGGDADLAGSTKTLIKGAENTGPGKPAARNVRFGVREHAMGSIVNGLAVHGGIIKPYSATFLTFSDYMRGAIRLGALMNIPTVYVFTHDSIGLGEDGPTHQPVEQVMSLRLIPNLYLFRPADANETAASWHTAMTLAGPSTLIFTRQNLPVLENVEQVHEGVAHGAYVLADSESTPDVILLAAGSEVEIAMNAYQTLMAEGVKARVVSMPCWKLFEEQDVAYKEAVLPAAVSARVSVEAGVTSGWERYVGLQGVTIGVDRFGASAPYKLVYEKLGVTAEAVVKAAKGLL